MENSVGEHLECSFVMAYFIKQNLVMSWTCVQLMFLNQMCTITVLLLFIFVASVMLTSCFEHFLCSARSFLKCMTSPLLSGFLVLVFLACVSVIVL